MPFTTRQTNDGGQQASPFRLPARLVATPDADAGRPSTVHRSIDPLRIKVATGQGRQASEATPAPMQQAQAAPLPEMIPGPADDYSDDDYTSLDGIDPLDSQPAMGTAAPIPPSPAVPLVPDATAPAEPGTGPSAVEEGLDESEFLPTIRTTSLGSAKAADYAVPVGDAGLVDDHHAGRPRGRMFRRGTGGKTKKPGDATAPVPAPTAPGLTASAALGDDGAESPETSPASVGAGGQSDRKPARKRHASGGRAKTQAGGLGAGSMIGLALGSGGVMLSIPLLSQAAAGLLGVPGMAVFLGLLAVVVIATLVLGFVSLGKNVVAGAVTIVFSLVIASGAVGFVYSGTDVEPLSAVSVAGQASSQHAD